MKKNLQTDSMLIRKNMKNLRAMHFENKTLYKEHSIGAQENLIKSDIWTTSSHIALYIPFRGEVDTELLIHTGYVQNKCLYFPRCHNPQTGHGKMDFINIEEEAFLKSFEEGTYGIREPLNSLSPTQLPEKTLIITPCLAYNKQGFRLGYGGGYYDRLLSVNAKFPKHNPYYFSALLVFSFQENSSFISNEWDMPTHYISTEKEMLCTL